ncbi:hypothetical protein C0993_002673, partial [Termitomyces sp. T159_Od127]
MPDAFFTSSKPRKRKRVDSGAKGNSGSATKFSRKGQPQGLAKHGSSRVNGVQKKKRRVADEELSDHTDEGEGGIDDMDLRADKEDVGASGDEDDEETPAEKRLRLAKLYLESVKESLADGEFDAGEIDKELISARLKQDLVVWDVEKGEWIKAFGGNLGHKDTISVLSFRKGTHQLYTGSFDRTLKVYDLSPSVMGYVETLFGHQDHVLSVDALRGETCVSVGGRDKTVRYWKIVEETQLVFRGGGRSRVREVLDGGLRGDDEGDDPDDELEGTRANATTKKFIEGSIECVAMIDETTFVSGGDSGSLCLWSTLKKKPIFTEPLAHGFNEAHSETEGLIRTPRWVTSVASLRYSDVIASGKPLCRLPSYQESNTRLGSWEGDIRIWKLDAKLKSFALVGTVPAPGVVNSLQLLSPPPEFFERSTWINSSATESNPEDASAHRHKSGVHPFLLVAGVGQEHRFGRWLNVKEGVVNGTI